MRSEERQRSDSLYWPRLLMKIPKKLHYDEWDDVIADYAEQSLKKAEIRYHRSGSEVTWPPGRPDDPEPVLDQPETGEIRRIVFGWNRAVDPAEFFCFNDQFDPSPDRRQKVEDALQGWPNSVLAMAQLVTEYGPVVGALEPLAAVLTTDALGWITTKEDRQRLRHLCDLGSRVRALLQQADEALGDWEVDSHGRLRAPKKPGSRGGKAKQFVVKLIEELYDYLQPIYRRCFDDNGVAPFALQEQVGRILSPFFAESELSTERDGRIHSAFKNAFNRR